MVSNDEFCDAVHCEFLKMYPNGNKQTGLREVGEELLEVASISDGVEELKVSSAFDL